VERVRRELILEIQPEREKAQRRAAQQRRELQIEVEPPPDRSLDDRPDTGQ
jgi:hypothetical protein